MATATKKKAPAAAAKKAASAKKPAPKKAAAKKDITERVKSFEDACKLKGLDPTKLPNVGMLDERFQNSVIAQYKLLVICEALNEGWVPDWDNYNEWKYYPWFDLRTKSKTLAGSGFSFSDYGYDAPVSNVGARLCYKTRQLAEYAGKQFEDIYRDLMR